MRKTIVGVNGDIPVPNNATNAELRQFCLKVLDAFNGNLNLASKALCCSPTTLMRIRDGKQENSTRIRKQWRIPIHPKRIRISGDLENREDVEALHWLAKHLKFESWTQFCQWLANNSKHAIKADAAIDVELTTTYPPHLKSW